MPKQAQRLIIFAVFTALAGIVLLALLYRVRSTLLLTYVSLLLAVGLAPLVRRLEGRRLPLSRGRTLPRAAAILIIYLLLFGAIFVIGRVVLPPLIEQAEALWRNLPERLAAAQGWLVQRGILQRPLTLGEVMRQAPTSESAGAVTSVLGAVLRVIGGAFGLVTLLLLTFYLLLEAEGIFRTFVRLFPAERRDQVTHLGQIVAVKVSAWLGGQLLLSLIIGVSAGVFLWAAGVPYPFVLALISAIGELVPMVGPIVAAIPAVLVAVTVSAPLAVGTAVFFVIQQQVENAVLVPKIMGRQVGLSAVTVIVALGIGSELLGLVGAILSVPTVAILQVLFEEWLLNRNGADEQVST